MTRSTSVLPIAGAIALSLAACSAPEPEPTHNPTARMEFYEQVYAGYELLEAGDAEGALEIFRALDRSAPEHAERFFHQACALSGLGEVEAGLEALERAVDEGFWEPERTEGDEDLASLRDDPRFAALVARMASELAEWNAAAESYRPDPPSPSDAPGFESLAELEAEFGNREERVRQLPIHDLVQEERRWRVLDEKLAALRRLESERPAEGAAAARARVETLLEYRELGYDSRWPGLGPLIVEEAAAYLESYPEGEQRTRIAWLGELATWLGRDGDGGAERADYVRRLAAFEARLAGELEAGHALAWQLRLAGEDGDAPRVHELAKRLYELYGTNEEVMDAAWAGARDALFADRGLSDFAGEDLEGRTWNAATMRGRVVLVDFWATWCQPCVAELPAVKAAYARFHDAGLEIVGVSLDDEDHLSFTTFLAEHELPWPQIHEGQGWGSKLVARYGVTSIPFMVLVDREGRVVAHGHDVEELIPELERLLPL